MDTKLSFVENVPQIATVNELIVNVTTINNAICRVLILEIFF